MQSALGLLSNSKSSLHSVENSNNENHLNGNVGSKLSEEETHKNVAIPRDVIWLRECKAAYLGIKPNVAEDLVCVEELTRALQRAGFNPSWQTMERYWCNNTGSVSFDRFCDIVEMENSCRSTDPLDAFRTLDHTNSGTISYEQLWGLMTTKGEKMSEEEFQQLFKLSPFLKDGQFDYKNFCETVKATSDACRRQSMDVIDNREKQYKKNCNTYVIKRKGSRSKSFGSRSSSLTENESSDLNRLNFKDWPKWQSKGCFYLDENQDGIVSHQYVLELPSTSNVWLTIEPFEKNISGDVVDTLLYILKDGETTSRQLIAYTEKRNENGRYYLGTNLEAGKYVLLPFTSGCRFRKSNKSTPETRTQLVKKSKTTSGAPQVQLTNEYKSSIEKMFHLVDLDGNGRLNRQEFTLFQWRTCGEEVQDDEWAALEATFELEDDELTLNGFIDAHLLEAENNDGKEEELWCTLHAMGFNNKLQLTNACPFLLQVYTEEPDATLRISALKNGGTLLEKAICHCVVDRGRSSKVRNLNDLIMYTYVSQHHATITVQNKAHSTVYVRLDCHLSQNCCSHRDALDFTLECLPKSMMIGHHLMPLTDSGEPWQVTCIESVVK